MTDTALQRGAVVSWDSEVFPSVLTLEQERSMADSLWLKPHNKDLGGGFVVRRLLPAASQRAVGPFIFFDHFGPVAVQPEDAHDVRPHPHIGLATVTYLFEGGILHRDNLGHEQLIEPGAINWMHAGRGIVHSERRPTGWANRTYINHGLQLWVALPQAHERSEPFFEHVPAHALPELDVDGAQVRLLVGQAWGQRSPVQTCSPTLYLDVQLSPNAEWVLPQLAQEQALYCVKGSLSVEGEPWPGQSMRVQHGPLTLRSGAEGARWVVIGGDPLGERYLWWNFVSTDRAALRQAAQAWAAGDGLAGMGPVPGEVERIELPPLPWAQD